MSETYCLRSIRLASEAGEGKYVLPVNPRTLSLLMLLPPTARSEQGRGSASWTPRLLAVQGGLPIVPPNLSHCNGLNSGLTQDGRKPSSGGTRSFLPWGDCKFLQVLKNWKDKSGLYTFLKSLWTSFNYYVIATASWKRKRPYVKNRRNLNMIRTLVNNNVSV